MTQQQALDILKTGANVFLTGEPGSGKTHTVNAYIRYLKAAKLNVAVTASTGIAATHLGGVTLHSWSGIGIKKTLSKYDVDRIATTQRLARRIEQTTVLIIDEVSMLDGRVLDSVNTVCQEIKRNKQPFGGLQVVLVGDFFQLPPVSREDEDSAQFAFTSAAWASLKPLVCYLSEQHRQEDQRFLELLTSLRRAAIATTHRTALDERCVQPPTSEEQALTQLYSHNIDVDRINQEQLERIKGTTKRFHMKQHGKQAAVQQLKRGCLSPEQLLLKEDAVVMFTKNDQKGKFVNGTIGRITGWHTYTKCPIVTTKSGRRIDVEPLDWKIEDNGRVVARITQLPLRLAWAMTVHKSQGMSLDAAAIDLTKAFEAGQGYVALSRVRTLQGLFLAGYNEQALQVHPDVLEHDKHFRQLSDEAQATFARLSAAELTTMHHNFVRAAGGVLPRSKEEAASRQHADSPATGKVYDVTALRQQYPNAYRPWQKKEDQQLTTTWRTGATTKELANQLGRQPGAIRSRLRKLGLVKA